MTIKTEGQEVTIETILLAIDFLLERYEKGMIKYAYSTYILSAIQTG